MKSFVSFVLAAPSALLPSRSRLTVLRQIAAAFLLCSLGHAQTVTSAVPGLFAYQGKVSNSSGTLVGAGTPVNRTVIFRIWSHQSNSTVGELVYSEQQTVTISEGEFSVLIGQGSVVSGTPLGYSETSKGPPATTIASATVFGSATRYLGVTIDDGTGTADPEVSPRQQMVTSAFAFRAKYAETVGANGANTITALDNGNVGVGTSNPGARLDVNGTVNVFDGGSKTYAGGLASESGGQLLNYGMNDARFGAVNNAQPGGFLRIDPRGTTFGGDLFQFYSRAGGSTSAAQIMGISATGNVGIGTSSPAQRLVVNGDTLTTGAAYLLDTNHSIKAISGGGVAISTFQVTNGLYLQQTTGNVGIGTTSPSAKLHVSGGITSTSLTTGSLNLTGPVSTSGGVSTHTQGAWLEWNKNTGGGQTYLLNQRGTGSGGIIFGEVDTANTITERMRIDSAGNVGIGTASPVAKLHLAGGSTEFSINTGSLNGTANSNAVTLDIPSTGTLSVWDNLVVSGNLGVGTTSPATTLDVRGTTPIITVGTTGGAEGAIYLGNSAHGVKRNYSATNDVGLYTTSGDVYLSGSGAGNTGHLVVKNSGNVGIGIADPKAPLHVRRADNFTNSPMHTRKGGSDTAYGVYLGGNGGFMFGDGASAAIGDNETIKYGNLAAIFNGEVVSHGGYWVGHALNYSDARAKTLLGSSNSARDLNLLRDLKIRDFTWIDRTVDNHGAHKKLIAQEVEQTFPQAVRLTPRPTAIPNVYQVAEKLDFNAKRKELRLTVGKPHDLKVGDSVDLATDTAPMQEMKVTAVSGEREFAVSYEKAPKSVFVYGKYVTDFRAVDYDAIAMLNVSATQELARQVESLKASEARNAELARRVAELEAKDSARDAKLAFIERLLQSSQTVMARPAKPATDNGQE